MSGNKRSRTPSPPPLSPAPSSPTSGPGWLSYDPTLKLADCLGSSDSDAEEEEQKALDELIQSAAKTTAKITRMLTTDTLPLLVKMHIHRRATPALVWTEYPLSIDHSFKGDPALSEGVVAPFCPRKISCASLYGIVDTRIRAIKSIGMTALEVIEIRPAKDLTIPPLPGLGLTKISSLGIGADSILYVCITPWEDPAEAVPHKKKRRLNEE